MSRPLLSLRRRAMPSGAALAGSSAPRFALADSGTVILTRSLTGESSPMLVLPKLDGRISIGGIDERRIARGLQGTWPDFAARSLELDAGRGCRLPDEGRTSVCLATKASAVELEGPTAGAL
jgi:hypothetical protein